jgi:hypothetical protein
MAHRKRAVAILPSELMSRLAEPQAGVGLDRSNRIGHRDLCWKAGEKVNVVGHASDLEKATSLLLNDASHVVVETCLDLACNQGGAVLGAENDVVDELRIRVPHGGPIQDKLGAKPKIRHKA